MTIQGGGESRAMRFMPRMNNGFLLRRVVLVLVLLPLLAAMAWAGEPTDGQGNVGRTSYATLPFSDQIYAPCWGCSPYLVPGQLYFSANPASIFNNASSMLAARYGSAAMEASGVVPSAGAQRWEDTYDASFPVGTFPNAPSWLASDATSGGFPSDAAFVAWRNFITNHPQYWDVAYDGGTMPEQAGYFRAWGGQWGHISPLTPLDAVDCPPGMASCTYGDLFAYQWAQTSGLSGGYGVTMADFTESQPVQSSNSHDFNPRIVAAFAAATGLAVPSGSTAAQAQWIVANAQTAWNDYLSQGYGKFFAALAARMGAATGRQALLVAGGSVTPSWRRWVGTDQRILAQYVNPANYLCLWDEQVIQVGRGGGPQPAPVMQELAGFAVAAAREPLMRNGASLEADDAAYWAAISSYYPTLSASAQTEIGYKLLKRLWLWSAWAHIADRNGMVRRAMAFAARDYWDAGTLTALNPLTKLIQTIMPTQPFGPALYYSTAVERTLEQQSAAAVGVGGTVNVYLNNPVLQTFIDSGGVVGYYVSDAALPKIVKGHADAPSAWIVLNADGTLPASERNQLAAIAPIVTSRAALASLPNQPLAFTGGLTGFGFYDQNHRLIVVVSNPSSNATAGTLTGMMNLTHLSGTSYTATEMFTGATTHITAAGNRASVPLSVARWDTQVFAITSP
jgi:hypothetical protein